MAARVTMRAADAEPGLKRAAADGLAGAANDRDDDEDVDVVVDTVSMTGGTLRGVLVLDGRVADAEMSGARAGLDKFKAPAAAAIKG